jgi:hypothetical protein
MSPRSSGNPARESSVVVAHREMLPMVFPPLFFTRWKPILVLDQATQIFDLPGVTGVAVDDAGKPNTQRGERLVLRLVKCSIQIGIRNG